MTQNKMHVPHHNYIYNKRMINLSRGATNEYNISTPPTIRIMTFSYRNQKDPRQTCKIKFFHVNTRICLYARVKVMPAIKFISESK